MIEPDADGDEFGDETQDKCPQQGGIQAGCPPVAALGPPAPIVLDAEAVAKKGSLLILVSMSGEASVSVSGAVEIRWPETLANADLPALTQTVGPGQLGRSGCRSQKALKTSLALCRRGRSLKATIQVRATTAAGADLRATSLNVRLLSPAR